MRAGKAGFLRMEKGFVREEEDPTTPQTPGPDWFHDLFGFAETGGRGHPPPNSHSSFACDFPQCLPHIRRVLHHTPPNTSSRCSRPNTTTSRAEKSRAHSRPSPFSPQTTRLLGRSWPPPLAAPPFNPWPTNECSRPADSTPHLCTSFTRRQIENFSTRTSPRTSIPLRLPSSPHATPNSRVGAISDTHINPTPLPHAAPHHARVSLPTHPS